MGYRHDRRHRQSRPSGERRLKAISRWTTLAPEPHLGRMRFLGRVFDGKWLPIVRACSPRKREPAGGVRDQLYSAEIPLPL